MSQAGADHGAPTLRGWAAGPRQSSSRPCSQCCPRRLRCGIRLFVRGRPDGGEECRDPGGCGGLPLPSQRDGDRVGGW
eukprot:6514379-Pyramimonas_sp.AAC.1